MKTTDQPPEIFRSSARPSILEYIGLERINGPLLVVQGVKGASFDEQVEILVAKGPPRQGRVLSISEECAVIEVFEGTSGLSQVSTRVRFLGHPFELAVSREEVMGRVFDGLGQPLDGGPLLTKGARCDINGLPINPVARVYPEEFIQTGVSAIDGMNTLVRGQKLPIFSGSGLAHNELAAQIVRQARLLSDDQGFAVIFAAMGVRHDEAEGFRRSFEESGVLQNVAMFLNLADDPAVERLITPRVALTVAEHLAFEEGMHVLVLLTDMTNYCEALREVATSKGEVPSRKGYPGYLYSDLASIYERAGRLQNRPGSVTQIPILTMPDDDITHPIPDLTGYITEGQIVLDRSLAAKSVYPPVNVLPSLSRLMSDGIGPGRTREDHQDIANQLYAAYARAREAQRLAAIVGEEDISPIDKLYLRLAREFEARFLGQRPDENRTIRETLDLAWELVMLLPEQELSRLKPADIDSHGRGQTRAGAQVPWGEEDE
ncbi:V-type ATP synthase subunit B [Desulfogranum mediterraneum]|uniref:V-type ATP synthase subunit B n=1 Tax=Desulfogranum mediterraneum TaxID=160661 RepID=UPI00041AE3A1|nr:V-type ATP synthase subunit B [Desulfogranum mediterraneum]